MKIPKTVLKLQNGHDFVRDRRTDDQGKNKMSPNPYIEEKEERQ